jgi:hypothetical protein
VFETLQMEKLFFINHPTTLTLCSILRVHFYNNSVPQGFRLNKNAFRVARFLLVDESNIKTNFDSVASIHGLPLYPQLLPWLHFCQDFCLMDVSGEGSPDVLSLPLPQVDRDRSCHLEKL